MFVLTNQNCTDLPGTGCEIKPWSKILQVALSDLRKRVPTGLLSVYFLNFVMENFLEKFAYAHKHKNKGCLPARTLLSLIYNSTTGLSIRVLHY